jgi:tetratricopeptide (TPR) repeat protein
VAAGGTRRVIGETAFLAALTLLVWSALWAFRERSLTVLPVSVPKEFEDTGYTSMAVSQRLAHEMSRVTGRIRAQPSEIAADAGTRVQRQIVGAQELTDIEIPGQEVSFRTVFRFVKNVIGLSDPALSISLSVDGEAFVADVLVVGGEQTGARDRLRMSKKSIEDFLRGTAVRAVAVSQPVSFAAYVADTFGRDCPGEVDCSLDEAERILARLLTDSDGSDDGSAYLALSAVALRKRDYDAAFEHGEAALRHDSSLGWSYVYCAYALSGQGRPKEAFAYAEKGARAGSWNADLHAGFGDVFIRLKRLNEAVREFDAATQLDPAHAYSFIGLGTALRSLHKDADPKAGIAEYRRALAINPVEPYAHGDLGIALVELGTFREAIPHLERALDFDASFMPVAQALQKARAATSVTQPSSGGVPGPR